MIFMDDNLHLHNRSIYTVWDFFGDVGGLFDMLVILAQPIFWLGTMVMGSGLDGFLIEALFNVQKKFDKQHKVEDYIKRRKPLAVKRCNWIYDRQNRRLSNIAKSSIDDQLDIVNFIRHQFASHISHKLHFSKVERYLILKQATPFVIKEKDQQSLIEKFEETEPPKLLEKSSKTSNYSKLVAGVFAGKVQEMYEIHEKSRIHRDHHENTRNEINDQVETPLRLSNEFSDDQNSEYENQHGAVHIKEQKMKNQSDSRTKINHVQSVELVAKTSK